MKTKQTLNNYIRPYLVNGSRRAHTLRHKYTLRSITSVTSFPYTPTTASFSGAPAATGTPTRDDSAPFVFTHAAAPQPRSTLNA